MVIPHICRYKNETHLYGKYANEMKNDLETKILDVSSIYTIRKLLILLEDSYLDI